MAHNATIPLLHLFGYPAQDLPRFSPCGTYHTFIAPHKTHPPTLWLAGTDTTAPRQLLKPQDDPLVEYTWAHTGKHILFRRDTTGSEHWHLHVLDLLSGSVTNITPHEYTRVRSYQLSAQAPEEVFMVMNSRSPHLFDAHRYNLRTGQHRILAHNDGSVLSWYADHQLNVRAKVVNYNGSSLLYTRITPHSSWQHRHTWYADDTFVSGPLSFSTDGRFLYFTDATDTDTIGLHMLDVYTGEKRQVLHDTDYDMHSGNILQDMNVKAHPNLTTLRTKDGHLSAYSYYRDRLTWRVMPNTTPSPLHQLLLDQKTAHWIEDDTLNHLIIGRCSDTKAPSFVRYHRATQTVTPLYHTRPQLQAYSLAPTRAIQFKSRDGFVVHGYLTMPLGTTHAPLVLKVHGGPWMRDVNGFQPDVQFLANRGYACLQINYRGSSGYGKTFINAGNKEWGGRMIDDLADGAQWACDQGITSPKQMAVMGRSYGGFAALCAGWRYEELFTCAIVEVPLTHLPRLYETMTPHLYPFKEIFYNRLGHPTFDASLLSRFSPALNTEKLNLPLLLAHGQQDPRVPDEQIQLFLDALKSSPLDVTLLSYKDEGHYTRREKNRIDFYQNVELFLDRHLPLMQS